MLLSLQLGHATFILQGACTVLQIVSSLLPLKFVAVVTNRCCLSIYNDVAVLTTRSCYLYPSGRMYSSTDCQFTAATEIRCCRYKSLLPLQYIMGLLSLQLDHATFSLQGACRVLQIVSSLLPLKFVAVVTNRCCLYNYIMRLLPLQFDHATLCHPR